MRYRIVAVGRMKNAALRAVCDEYLERLRHYTKVEEHEVKDEARVLGAVPEGARLVALTRRGDEWSSVQLAEWTEKWDMDGRDVVFAIGGAAKSSGRSPCPRRVPIHGFPPCSAMSCRHCASGFRCSPSRSMSSPPIAAAW